ncbi:transmembrane protein 181 isoform X4 [Pan troglodytes]|nr:transmembrane protein 181 isoform X4 [Pan troglodytes]
MRGQQRTQKREQNRQRRTSLWSVGLLLRAQGGGRPHPFCRWFDCTAMHSHARASRAAQRSRAVPCDRDRVFPKPHMYYLGLYRVFFCLLALDTGCSKRNDPCLLEFSCDWADTWEGELAPMRLYTLSKRHFVLVFVVFFICFGLTIFVGIRGPKVIQTSAANFSLNNSKKLKPIQILSNPLSTYNQQLWLTCVVELDQSKETSIKTSFPMTVKVDGVAQDGTTMYIHNKVHNRTRTLTCAGKCAEIIVAHLGYLNYTQYTVIVGFEHLKLPIKGMNFTWKTYNPAFSRLEIWFRFFFVVLTFIVTCLFAHSLRKFSMRDWGIEQKWMSVLLPLLLLYNDPFFPLSFLVNSWLPGMLDDLFQSMFLCALLLFWLCVYHGIRVQGERKCLTFYLPKFFIVGLLWLASVTLGIWQTRIGG